MTSLGIIILLLAIIGAVMVLSVLLKWIASPFRRITSTEKRAEAQSGLILKQHAKLNNVYTNIKDIENLWQVTEDKILALEVRHNKRISSIELLAENFDRDMNRFNREVMRDVNKRFDNIAIMLDGRLSKFEKGLGRAFKSIHKLELRLDMQSVSLQEFNKGFDKTHRELTNMDTRLHNSVLPTDVMRRIEALERAIDTYKDTTGKKK